MWNLNLFYPYGGKLPAETLILKLALDPNEKHPGCLEVANPKLLHKDASSTMVTGILQSTFTMKNDKQTNENDKLTQDTQ